MEDLEVEEAWNMFKESIRETIKNNVPKKEISQEQRVRPKWMNKEAKDAVKRKKKTFSKYLYARKNREYQKYVKARNACKKAIREAKRSFETKLAQESKANPKAFWRYVSSKTKLRTGVGTLQGEGGKMAVTDEEKAEVINTFFSKVFTREDKDNIPNIQGLKQK